MRIGGAADAHHSCGERTMMRQTFSASSRRKRLDAHQDLAFLECGFLKKAKPEAHYAHRKLDAHQSFFYTRTRWTRWTRGPEA